MGSRQVKVEIIGNADSLERAFGRASKASSGFHKGLNTASIAAGGALLALGAAAKVGFGEFNEGQKAAAQTAAVLKSTGGVAGVTAKQVDVLASSLLRKSGVDDEVIKSGANVLLAFTRIHNEAGRGPQIFDRATKAALDFSVRTGVDMPQAAKTLGKALNDPIGGLGALAKAGVKFTDDQRAAIKAMVDGGNTAGAQIVVLRELESRYGGAAAAAGGTFAGKLSIAREGAKNFAGELVAGAVPALSVLAGALGRATAFMESHKTTTKVAIGVVTGLATGILVLKAATASWAAITAIASAVQGVFVTRTAVATAATAAQAAAQTGLNVALTANPIGIVITALAAIGIGFVLAYRHSEKFRAVVKGALGVAAAAAGGVVTAVRAIVNAIQAVASSSAVKAIGAVIAGSFGVALAMIERVIGAIRSVVNAAQSAAGFVKNAFGGGRDPSKSGEPLNPYLRAKSTKSLGGFTSPGLRVALAELAPGRDNSALLAALRGQEGAGQGTLARALSAQAGIGGLQSQLRGATPARRIQLLDAIANREQNAITAANNLLSIRQQIASLESDTANAQAQAARDAAQAALDAIAQQRQNRVDELSANIALARLTEGTQDDLIAYRQREADLVAQLADAQARGDNAATAAAASDLFGVRGDISGITPTSGTTTTSDGITMNIYPSGSAGNDPGSLMAAAAFYLRGLIASGAPA